jgi:hypothetical protein
MCALPSCRICVPQNPERKCAPENDTINSVRAGGSAAAGAAHMSPTDASTAMAEASRG